MAEVMTAREILLRCAHERVFLSRADFERIRAEAVGDEKTELTWAFNHHDIAWLPEREFPPEDEDD